MTTTLHRAAPTRPATTGRPRTVWRRLAPAACTIAVLLAAGLPAVAGPYVVTLTATGIVLALLAISTQLLAVAGLPSFGQTAMLGVGAYTAAVLANTGVTSAPVQLLAATAAAALTAALLAPIVLRTRAVTFLMVTVMLQGLADTIAAHWTPVTGGDDGLHTPPATLTTGLPLTTTPGIFWYTLAVFAVVSAGVFLVMRSRLALLLRGHAGHEQRMTALGHRPTVHLGAGYVIAGAVAGAGGSLLVVINQYVSPGDIGFGTAAAGFIAAGLAASLTGRPSMTAAVAAATAVVAVRDAAGSNGAGPLLLGLLCLAVPYLRPAATAYRQARRRRTETPS